MFWFFLPSNENRSESIEPTMGSFNYPSPSFFSSLFFDFISLNISWSNMKCKSKLLCKNLHLITDISCIKTKMLFFEKRRFWSFDQNIIKRWFCKFYIVPVGSICCKAKRYSSSISEYTSLASLLSSVDGVCTCFFFHRVELWL